MHKKTLLILTVYTVASLAVFQVAYSQANVFKITPEDGAPHDKLGYSVSISGDYAVVGAPADDDNGTESGSAYVFKRNGTSWVQEAKLLPLKEDGTSDGGVNNYFGRSVSISGDYVIVGAYGSDDNDLSNSGSAYIFRRTNTSWIQEAKLHPSDRSAEDWFGWSVSISGDYAIIGARGSDDNDLSNSGSAYIFRRTDTSWIQEAKLLPSDRSAEDWFGWSVSISGDYAIVGAPGNDDNGTDAGSAYLFKCTGATWAQEAKLISSDGAEDDLFGQSVSISGDYAIVGAPENDDNGTDTGSAYLFKRTGATWAQESKLLSSDGAEDDLFGYSVSISGAYAIVGTRRVDDNGINSGSAYLFKRTSASWSPETKLLPSDGAFNDLFGYSVSISGYYAVVGASRDNNEDVTDSAFPFEYTSTNWVEDTILIAFDAEPFDWFGWSVSISGDYAVAGAWGDNDNGTESGSAYVFKRTSKSWAEKTKMKVSDETTLDELGFSVSAYLIRDFGLQAAQCIDPPHNIVAWWSLDETSGTVADDITGSNSVGTHLGSPVSVLGKVDGALSFNGATDYVEIADHPDLNFGTGDFSIDAWVKTNISTGTRTVADKRSGTNFNPLGYSLYIYNGYVGLQLADKSGFYNYNNNLDTSTSIANGQWHHIAVTVDRDDFRGLKFYIDGVLESTKNPMPYNGSLNNSSVFRIACQSYVVDPDYMFNGVIDELELFDRVITPAEVRAIWVADSLGKCK
jgi:hypothetical protein